MKKANLLFIALVTSSFFFAPATQAQDPAPNPLMEVPPIESSWTDLTDGITSKEDWEARRPEIKQAFLDLLRDQYKPERPPLDLQVHETVDVEGIYTRKLVSYAVEADERAHAYIGIPLERNGKLPAVVALAGTYKQGARRAAGLEDNPDKAYLDHLCRRGYVVIAPEHFVSGHRIPPKGPYDTTAFYEKHPEWTAVGKFTYEHSIAIDVLETLEEVDTEHIGVLGHSLGGHGSIFLAAYDERIEAAASNCAAPSFRHDPGVVNWARDHWYVYFKHLRPGMLNNELPPIDFHHMVALTAPRPMLQIVALNDGNPGTQKQRVLMMLEIANFYNLIGAPENYAFYTHGRGHSVPHESRALMYAWMDTYLKPAEAIATKLVAE